MKCFEGRNIDTQEEQTGETALHVAVKVGNNHMMDALMSRGANLEIRDKGGLTALDKAVLSGQFALAKELFETGNYTEVDTNMVFNGSRGEDGLSLLQMACVSGDVETFKWIESLVSGSINNSLLLYL